MAKSIKLLHTSLASKGGFTTNNPKTLKDLKTLMGNMRTVRAADVTACTGFVNEAYGSRLSLKELEDYRDTKLGTFCDARCACNARTPCACDARTPCACNTRTANPYYCNCVSRTMDTTCDAQVITCTCKSRWSTEPDVGYYNNPPAGDCPSFVSFVCTCQSRTGVADCSGYAIASCTCDARTATAASACLCNIRTIG